MGLSKTANYTAAQNKMATILKALGHPARIAIIEFLLASKHCICGDIVNELPLAQPTISQHLKELKNAGIIKGNIEGNAICYCIEQDSMDYLKNYFSNISINLSQINCC